MQLNEIKTIFFETDGTPLANALGGLNIHVQLEKHDKKDADPDFQPIVVKYVCSYENVFDRASAASALKSYITSVGTDKGKIEEKYDDTIGNIATIKNAVAVMTQKFSYGIQGIPEVAEIAKTTDKATAQAFLTSLIEPDVIRNLLERRHEDVKDVLTVRSERIAATLMKRANTQAFSTESVQQIQNFISSPQYKALGDGALTELKNRIELLFAVFGRLKLNATALAEVGDALGKTLGINSGQTAGDLPVASKPGTKPVTGTKPAPEPEE